MKGSRQCKDELLKKRSIHNPRVPDQSGGDSGTLNSVSRKQTPPRNAREKVSRVN